MTFKLARFGSAPAFRRSRRQAWWPLQVATNKGVIPCGFLETTNDNPFAEAHILCIGVNVKTNVHEKAQNWCIAEERSHMKWSDALHQS